MHLSLGFLGTMELRWLVNGATFLAIATCLLAVCLLYRKITDIGWMSKVLWSVVMGAIAWIIFTGVTHFDPKLAFSFPPGAFHLSSSFFTGLGAAMLIATPVRLFDVVIPFLLLLATLIFAFGARRAGLAPLRARWSAHRAGAAIPYRDLRRLFRRCGRADDDGNLEPADGER